MNANFEKSNIDSGDEHQPTGDGNILSDNQQLGSAVLQIKASSGQEIRGHEEGLINKTEKLDNCQPKATKQIKTNNLHVSNWHLSDIRSYNEFTWKLEAPILDKTDSPTTS